MVGEYDISEKGEVLLKEYSISKRTIDRLPLYLRELRQCQRDGIHVTNSVKFGRRIGVTPEQIRKDLASFGDFGKKGVGYIVKDLILNIKSILGLNRKWNIAILGAGHLGRALANNLRFDSINFNLVAIFDVDSNIIGRTVKNVEISGLDKLEALIVKLDIDIAVITTPAIVAQALADRLIVGGISGIWNFAPVKLKIPENIPVINEDLSIGITTLSFYLANEIANENFRFYFKM